MRPDADEPEDLVPLTPPSPSFEGKQERSQGTSPRMRARLMERIAQQRRLILWSGAILVIVLVLFLLVNEGFVAFIKFLIMLLIKLFIKMLEMIFRF